MNMDGKNANSSKPGVISQIRKPKIQLCPIGLCIMHDSIYCYEMHDEGRGNFLLASRMGHFRFSSVISQALFTAYRPNSS